MLLDVVPLVRDLLVALERQRQNLPRPCEALEVLEDGGWRAYWLESCVEGHAALGFCGKVEPQDMHRAKP